MHIGFDISQTSTNSQPQKPLWGGKGGGVLAGGQLPGGLWNFVRTAPNILIDYEKLQGLFGVGTYDQLKSSHR